MLSLNIKQTLHYLEKKVNKPLPALSSKNQELLRRSVQKSNNHKEPLNLPMKEQGISVLNSRWAYEQ